jgi:hypothetical protein
MKNLGKLQINPEKLIKNEELITLKGGRGACTCCCVDYANACCYGYLVSPTGDCDTDCKNTFGQNSGGGCYNCGPACPSCAGY